MVGAVSGLPPCTRVDCGLSLAETPARGDRSCRASAASFSPIVPTARRRRSANTPQAGEILHKIGGGRNAFGGVCHPGGALAGPREVKRGGGGGAVRPP